MSAVAQFTPDEVSLAIANPNRQGRLILVAEHIAAKLLSVAEAEIANGDDPKRNRTLSVLEFWTHRRPTGEEAHNPELRYFLERYLPRYIPEAQAWVDAVLQVIPKWNDELKMRKAARRVLRRKRRLLNSWGVEIGQEPHRYGYE